MSTPSHAIKVGLWRKHDWFTSLCASFQPSRNLSFGVFGLIGVPALCLVEMGQENVRGTA